MTQPMHITHIHTHTHTHTVTMNDLEKGDTETKVTGTEEKHA